MVGQRHVIRDIDGAEVKFHKMTPYDRMEVAERLRVEKRAKLLAELKEAGATPQELMGEAQQFDNSVNSSLLIFEFIRQPVGCVETFLRALKATNGIDAESILKKFTPDADEEFSLALELWGMKLEPTKPATSEEDTDSYGSNKPANPQKPEEDSYSTPPAPEKAT